MAGKAKHTFATGFSMLLMVIALTSNGLCIISFLDLHAGFKRESFFSRRVVQG